MIKYGALALLLCAGPVQAAHTPPTPEAAKAVEDYSWTDAVAQWGKKCKRLSDAEQGKLAALMAENLKSLQKKYGFAPSLGAEIAQNNKTVMSFMGCDDKTMLARLESVKAKLAK